MSALQTIKGTKFRRRSAKISIYVILTVMAAVILFPFIVAATTSVKEADDVFAFPPTLIPQTAETVTIDGFDEPVPLYDVDVDGQTQQLALIEEGVSVGVYVRVDDQTTEILRLDEEVAGSETGATLNVDGDEEEIFAIDVDGQSVEVYRDRAATVGLFANPDNLDEFVLANVREQQPAETFSARFENYSDVLDLQRLDRSLTNTVLVTVLVVTGMVVTSILGGYAFARLHFAGRDKMFLLYLGSIMIPFVVLIIPLHQLVVSIGWIDSLVALVIPFIFTAYGTFLMRQFFIGIPKSLEEAALLDGASRWTILWRIFVPLSRPAIATLTAFGFLYAWNSFVWPLVVINAGNVDNRVLALSLQVLGGRAADSPNLVLAGVMIAVIPPITVFILAQRHFVESAASSGMKG